MPKIKMAALFGRKLIILASVLLRRPCLGYSKPPLYDKLFIFLIYLSRPLIALKELQYNYLIEIVGLTNERVSQFIDSNVAEASRPKIKSILNNMPLLKSLCQITFYCMAFCQIFGEGTEDVETLDTYTRIMAYVILVRGRSVKLDCN